TFDVPAVPYRYDQAWPWGSGLAVVGEGSALSVMAGRVPATHAPAVVQPPRRSHRSGAGGRDTPGHDGKNRPSRKEPAITERTGHHGKNRPSRREPAMTGTAGP